MAAEENTACLLESCIVECDCVDLCGVIWFDLTWHGMTYHILLYCMMRYVLGVLWHVMVVMVVMIFHAMWCLLGLFQHVSECHCMCQQCPGKVWCCVRLHQNVIVCWGMVQIYSCLWKPCPGKTVNATLHDLWHFISCFLLCHTVRHAHMFCMFGEPCAKTQPSICSSNERHMQLSRATLPETKSKSTWKYPQAQKESI